MTNENQDLREALQGLVDWGKILPAFASDRQRAEYEADYARALAVLAHGGGAMPCEADRLRAVGNRMAEMLALSASAPVEEWPDDDKIMAAVNDWRSLAYGLVPSYDKLVARLNQLAPLLCEVHRRAGKERANHWRPNSGEAFEVTVDQEMWEAIRSAL